jgi:hypothetical protein
MNFVLKSKINFFAMKEKLIEEFLRLGIELYIVVNEVFIIFK